MPFVSQAQRAFLYAKHPDIAKRWEKETPKGIKLPKHVHKKKMKAIRDNFMLTTGRQKLLTKKHKTMTRISRPSHTDKQHFSHKSKPDVHKAHLIHKHSSAHHKMSVAQMMEHHPHKMPVHMKGHPMHKHYKAGISNVRHMDGTHRTMEVGGHGM